MAKKAGKVEDRFAVPVRVSLFVEAGHVRQRVTVALDLSDRPRRPLEDQLARHLPKVCGFSNMTNPPRTARVQVEGLVISRPHGDPTVDSKALPPGVTRRLEIAFAS